MTTGPSINPIVISGLPLVSFINAVSFTKSKEFIMYISRRIVITSGLNSFVLSQIHDRKRLKEAILVLKEDPVPIKSLDITKLKGEIKLIYKENYRAQILKIQQNYP